MKKLMITIGVAIGLLFFLGTVGQVVGSLVYIRFAHADQESPGVMTLWTLYQASQGYILKSSLIFKLSVFVSVIFPIVGFIMPFFMVYAKPKRELHGSARFARAIEISKAGLLKDKFEEPDILVGKYKGKYLRWSGKQFAFLAAPTRSGKGVGIVIPNCLHYRDSLVVFDPKLENYRITGGFRALHGQEVFLFNPSAKDFRSHCWNPLTYVSRDPMFSTGGAFNIANILYSASANEAGNTRFFNEMAQKLFVGLCLYLIETEEQTELIPSLAEVLNLSTPKPVNGESISLSDWIKNETLRPDLSKSCKNNLLSFAASTGQTASGILSSFSAPLSIFTDPLIASMTTENDFDFRKLRKKKMTIYLGIAPNEISKFSRLINLFFSQLISENTNELPEDNPELKYQCLLLIDELAALGQVEILEKGVAYIAGYNIRILGIFQSLSQLERLYTAQGARTLVTNFECQIIYPPRDNKDAQEYAEIIGYETFKSKSTSRNQGGKGGGGSQSISDQKRFVMLPQEIKTMPTTDCIVTLTGIQPIYAEKIVYYTDPIFRDRLGFKPPHIPLLEIDGKPLNSLESASQEMSDDQALHQEEPEMNEELMMVLIKSLVGNTTDVAYIKEIKRAIEIEYSTIGLSAWNKVFRL